MSKPVGRRPAHGNQVALTAEEDFGRVDLDEANALAVAEHDGIAIAYIVNAVNGRSGDRTCRGYCERKN
jgi:hypothetical protein